MREIKFRAFLKPWMSETPKMIYCDSDAEYDDIYFCTGNKVYRTYDDYYSGYSISESRVLSIMQYTGLKDKNGKEIYEGDIVKFNDLFCEVYWDYAGFRIKPFPNSSISINTNRDFEVKGNIYENPELLK